MKNVDNKKFIGFDMDGVIINHSPVKIKLAKKFGFKIKPKETPSEIMKEIIDKPIWEQLQQILYCDPKFFKEAPLMRGVKSGLFKLRKNGLPFVLISRRHLPELAIEVLRHHGLWPKFFNEKNAFFVAKPEDKNVKSREMGITHYVDDELRVLEKLADVKNKFLFDNSGAFSIESKKGSHDGYTRIKSWKELIGYFLN